MDELETTRKLKGWRYVVRGTEASKSQESLTPPGSMPFPKDKYGGKRDGMGEGVLFCTVNSTTALCV